jgi:hypothetical protein
MPWKQSYCRCKSEDFSQRLMMLCGFLGHYQFPGYRTHSVGSSVTRPTDMETEHTLWGPLLQGLQIWKQNTSCGVLCYKAYRYGNRTHPVGSSVTRPRDNKYLYFKFYEVFCTNVFLFF